jgi:hypothetical protein
LTWKAREQEEVQGNGEGEEEEEEQGTLGVRERSFAGINRTFAGINQTFYGDNHKDSYRKVKRCGSVR